MLTDGVFEGDRLPNENILDAMVLMGDETGLLLKGDWIGDTAETSLDLSVDDDTALNGSFCSNCLIILQITPTTHLAHSLSLETHLLHSIHCLMSSIPFPMIK